MFSYISNLPFFWRLFTHYISLYAHCVVSDKNKVQLGCITSSRLFLKFGELKFL